jgi:hypothetical protein
MSGLLAGSGRKPAEVCAIPAGSGASGKLQMQILGHNVCEVFFPAFTKVRNGAHGPHD